MNQFTLCLSDVLQNISELAKGNVTDLAAPQLMHGLDIQRFQDDDVKAVGQAVGQLKEPVTPLVGNPFVQSGKVSLGFSPVLRTFPLPRHCAVGLANFSQGRSEPFRRMDGFTARQGEEGLQTEVRADDGVTQSVGRFFLARINGKAKEQFAKLVTLNGDRLDRAENFPAFAELVDQLANADTVRTDQLPAGLFQRERAIVLDLAKARAIKLLCDFAFLVLKEKLVATIKALANVLYGLRTDHTPKLVLGKLFQLGNVLLHRVDVDVLAGEFEIAPV